MYKIIRITSFLLIASLFIVNVHAAQMYSSEVVGVQFAQTPYPDNFKMMVLNTQKPGGKDGKKVLAKDGIVDVWPFVNFSENNKQLL